MWIHSAAIGFTVALALSATAGYAVQEFTLDEAQARIERLEARVESLEATIAAGTGGTPEASARHTVTGTVVIESSQRFGLEGPGPYDVGATCFGDTGFDDIGPGAAVRALDEAGNVVGLGRLSAGSLVDVGSGRECQFTWTMEVDDSAFYAFDVAGREGPLYSRDELEAAGWTVALSI